MSFEQAILNHIRLKPGLVWTTPDFSGLGQSGSMRMALTRLVSSGKLFRAAQGLYCVVERNALTGGVKMPSRQRFVEAVARRDNLQVVVDGMTAANDLGWDTAVPAKSTIFANGTPRVIEIADPAGGAPMHVLEFKQINNRRAFWAGHPGMRVVQALEYFRDVEGADETLSGMLLETIREQPDIGSDLSANVGMLPTWTTRVVVPVLDVIKAENAARDAMDVPDDEGILRYD